jgi:hypothetical protein
MGLIAASWRFPIRFGRQRKFYFDTTFLLAAVLFLAPVIAVPLCAAGTVLGQLLRGRSTAEVAFNSSQSAFQALLAGIALQWTGWAPMDDHRLGELMGALFLAGAIAYAVNTLLVNTMISLQSGDDLVSIVAPGNLLPGRTELWTQILQILGAGVVFGFLHEGLAVEALGATVGFAAVAMIVSLGRRISRPQAGIGSPHI